MFVRGDANDTLNLKATGVTWSLLDTVVEQGIVYDHWQDDRGHNLLREQEITLIAG